MESSFMSIVVEKLIVNDPEYFLLEDFFDGSQDRSPLEFLLQRGEDFLQQQIYSFFIQVVDVCLFELSEVSDDIKWQTFFAEVNSFASM